MVEDVWITPSVVAAFLSAIAAIAAAIATWRAPISAAKIAEKLRRQGDSELERSRFKLNVFAYIMQGRGELYSEESVRALNSIDVAFNDSVPVREAWAELYQALNSGPHPSHVLEERVRRLLKEMAQDLGLSDSLRLDDFSRVYFPTAMAQDREMRALEREQRLKALTSGAAPEQNASEALDSLWPPAPK